MSSGPETIDDTHEPSVDWRAFGELELSDIAEGLLARAIAHGECPPPTSDPATDLADMTSAMRDAQASAGLIELVESGLCDLISRLDAALAEAGDDPTMQLCSLVEATCLYVIHRRDLAVVERIVAHAGDMSPSRVQDLQRAVTSRFLTVAERGIAQGRFAVSSAPAAARSLIDMLYATASWHGVESEISAAEVAAGQTALSCAMVRAVDTEHAGRHRLELTFPAATPGLALRQAFTMTVQLSPLDDVGEGPFGRRLIFRVLGGTVHGDELNGTIESGGADWMLLSPDGYGRIDARLEITTGDGATLYMNYPGLVDFRTLNARRTDGKTSYDDHYYRCTPRIETGHRRYRWMNERVFASRGRMAGENLLEYEVFVVD